MGICCAVVGCFSSEREKSRAFFRFPKRLLLCRHWIFATGRPELESEDMDTIYDKYRICDLHFRPTQWLNNKLTPTSVPTINLPPEDFTNSRTKTTQTDNKLYLKLCLTSSNDRDSSPLTSTKCVGTEPEQSVVEDNSRKRKLSEQSCRSSKQEFIVEKEYEFARAHKKIEIVLYHLKCVHSAKVFDIEYKKLLMNLYLASPIGYRLLFKTFDLPDETFLRETVIDIETQLSDNMIKCLQYKCDKFSQSDKICVLTVSQMDLKPELNQRPDINQTIGHHEINGLQSSDLANCVVAVMAQGLFLKWTQPIGFCFIKQPINYLEVKDWVLEIMVKILSIGYNVVAITTDVENFFFNITKDKPVQSAYGNCIVKNHMFVNVFDVPRIIIMLRNILMTNNILFQNGDAKLIASWDDIQRLYNLEKDKTHRIACHLSPSHIRPQIYERATVKFAAQVFSKSVAVALQCYVESGKLPRSALGTATFVQRMNDVFEILNSDPSNDTYEHKKPFADENSLKTSLLDFLKLLATVTIVSKTNNDITSNVKCLSYLKATIYAILSLKTSLKQKGFTNIFTRRLNTDEIKDFFKSVMLKQGELQVPTPIEFYDTFKTQFIKSAIDTHIIAGTDEFSNMFKIIDEIHNDALVHKELLNIDSYPDPEGQCIQSSSSLDKLSQKVILYDKESIDNGMDEIIIEDVNNEPLDEINEETNDVENYIDYSVLQVI